MSMPTPHIDRNPTKDSWLLDKSVEAQNAGFS